MIHFPTSRTYLFSFNLKWETLCLTYSVFKVGDICPLFKTSGGKASNKITNRLITLRKGEAEETRFVTFEVIIGVATLCTWP
jgi:hypothetical protein